MLLNDHAHRPEVEHVDVLIVGAGLSGIDAAYRLQHHCPGKSFAIIEARDVIGGTWDLFRYPGVRSDSDMTTLGFPFRPWRGARAIAEGPDILAYIRDTAREHGIDRRVRFRHRLVRASWSSAEARWTAEIEADGRPVRITCAFLFMCSGYYDYDAGYTPDYPGLADFAGRFVHPQHWPDDLDVSGNEVVVIGSGATAVTLIPSLARQAAHVTMLQRSPTYIVAQPAEDGVAIRLRRMLPAAAADRLVRWKNVLTSMALYGFARRHPQRAAKAMVEGVGKALGPGHDIERDYTPSYNPWDQRICLAPDGDLFAAIREGRASVVTDHVERFEADGVRLLSGRLLPADIVVSATGLNVRMMGGATLLVDGVEQHLADTLIYKGMMLSGVPNFAFAFGYTNASWTLKCDLTARYVCRLINHMDRHGYEACTPQADAAIEEEPMVDFTSGYITRARDRMPRQGSKAPWRLHQNYALDVAMLGLGRVEDGVLRFTPARDRVAA